MRRLWAIGILMLTADGVSAATRADEPQRLKLRAQATVTQALTLGDVLSFRGADPALRTALADAPIFAVEQAARVRNVTFEQVEAALRSSGANLAQILLVGSATCRIEWRQPVETEAPAADPLLVRPADGGAARTLRAALQQHVAEELRELGGTPELVFERASEPYLDLTAPPWTFSIRSRQRGELGLREFRVVIRRDGRTQRTVDVIARVRLAKEVLVAAQPLNVGMFVSGDDVVLEKRVFERTGRIGLDDAAAVVGQRVRKFVPAGQMVRGADLETVELVRRSRPVTIRGAGEHVRIRVTGVALDSAGFGETVRVRVGDTRQNRQVLRGVVTGLGTVELKEGGL
jgi:flagella basal body P-ring formation protein FlgA